MSGSASDDEIEKADANYKKLLTSLESAHDEVAKLLAAGSKADKKKKSGFFKLAIKETQKLQKIQLQLNAAYKELQSAIADAADDE